MPREEPTAGQLPTRMLTLARAEARKVRARARAAGLGPVALCAIGLLCLSGLGVLIVCATNTMVAMFGPWLAVSVVAVVAPPRPRVPRSQPD